VSSSIAFNSSGVIHKVGYLTPDLTPVTVTCRALFIPNDEQYLAIVRGALQELTFSWNWTKDGALTPEQAANNFMPMFDSFCLEKSTCRMIGEIVMYGGSTSPNVNWLPCDGSEVAQGDYPDLYAVIGDNFGVASVGNFRLPDMRGRTGAGVGTGAGIAEVTLGQMYGASTHTLIENEMPAHVHAYDPVIVGDLDVEGAGVPQPNAAKIIPAITENTYSTGGGQAHNNLPPRLGVNFLIVARE